MLQRNIQQSPISVGDWRIGASDIGGRITDALRFATQSTDDRDTVGDPHSSCTSRCCARCFHCIRQVIATLCAALYTYVGGLSVLTCCIVIPACIVLLFYCNHLIDLYRHMVNSY
jgi:hypothetical protein